MISRLYYCVTVEHDLQLVLVAALLCALSAVASVAVVRRALAADRQWRLVWLAGCGLVTGSGVWGTHFVSMLAFQAPASLRFDLIPTALSLLLAVVVSMSGWAFAVLGGSRRSAMLGGGVVGAGVAAMHFMSINAMDLGASIDWDPVMVLAATGCGIAGGALSGVLLRVPGLRIGVGLAAVSLALAVAGLHFGAMAAMVLAPDLFSQAGAARVGTGRVPIDP